MFALRWGIQHHSTIVLDQEETSLNGDSGAKSERPMTLQAGARMSLLQGMIQGNEPSLRGLAVHRLRQDAAGALPAPGIFPQKGERPPFILLGELMTKEGLRRVIVFDQIWMFIPAGPHVWPGASSIRIKQ